MTPDELQSVLPLERVARPPRLAGGLAGQWRTPPAALAGVPFESTFFFAGGALKRVESVSVGGEASEVAAAFAEIVRWGRRQFGNELGSSDPGSAYAAWAEGDMDVYAQHTVGARHAVVRLVYKLREPRDGSAL